MIGILSDDHAVMDKLLGPFLQAFSVGVIALITYAVHSKREED